MMGSQNGVGRLLKDITQSGLIVVHAVAHVQQLGNYGSFSDVEYYGERRGIVQEVYTYYAMSGKKRFGLEEVANELGSSLLKINSTHGIRWAASQAKTVKAIMTVSVKCRLPSMPYPTRLAPSSLSDCEFPPF